MFSPILDRFAIDSPVSVMARAAIERVLNPRQLDEWFDSTAKEQYTKELLFSSVFDIMSQVICKCCLSGVKRANRRLNHLALQ